MRMILSPAKKMNVDTDSFPVRDLPRFLPRAQRLLEALRTLEPKQLQALWKCGDSIAEQNIARLREMDLRRNLTPAILAYEGIQYRYMAPGVMSVRQLEYLQKHLRILSGFYGILRPFDGVTPYRLEMQAKLPADGAKDLYSFWGGLLGACLEEEPGWVVNLASKEYSRAVTPYLSKSSVLTCVFGEWKDGRVIEKGTLCKMARGQMVRWMAQNAVEKPEELREFSDLNYQFHGELSTQNQYVFIQGGN